MGLLSKCVDRLPRWEDVTRNMPFIITGSVCVAFYYMSRQEQQKRNRSRKQRYQQQLEQPLLQELKSGSMSTQPSNAPQQPSSQGKAIGLQNKQQQAPSGLGTASTVTGGQEEEEQKVDTPSINTSAQQQQQQQQEQYPQTLKYIKKTRKEVADTSNSDSDNHPTKKVPSTSGIVSRGYNNNNSMNSSEYEFFNHQRPSQEEGDDQEDEESFDRIIDEDSGALYNLPTSQKGSSQLHNYNRNGTSEKPKKRAPPMRISRNFATDTENNEKIEKLKSIVNKEKKAEDKVFFQMFLNIVNTEVDEDLDD